MKRILLATILLAVFQAASAQPAEISRDANGSKTVKGFMTKHELVSDTAFAWFAANQSMFPVEQTAVEALKAKKDVINIIAFGGTWCDDTKMILPQFFAIADAAGFSEDRITLLGVDRDKKTQHHLSEAFNVTHVPTFIVMKNGKEMGRVVEYGNTGMPMKELAQVINSN